MKNHFNKYYSTTAESVSTEQTKIDRKKSRIHQFFRTLDIEGVSYMKCILCSPCDKQGDEGVLAVQASTSKNLFWHIQESADPLHQAQKEYFEAGKINGTNQ